VEWLPTDEGGVRLSPLEHYNTEPLRVVEALVSAIGTLFTVPIVIYLNSDFNSCQVFCCCAAELSVTRPRYGS
jgi:hypothetical protein